MVSPSKASGSRVGKKAGDEIRPFLSPLPKLGLEAAIARLRMFLKNGFDLHVERFVRQSPSLFGLLSLFLVIPGCPRNAKCLEENRQGSQPPGQRLLRQTDVLLKRKLISLPCPGKFLRRTISTSFLPRSSTQSRMRFCNPLFVRRFKEFSAFFQEEKLSLQEGVRMNAGFPGAFDERFFAFDPFQSRFELDGAGDGCCFVSRALLL